MAQIQTSVLVSSARQFLSVNHSFVNSVRVYRSANDPDLYVALAAYGPYGNNITFGLDYDPDMARFRAMMSAYSHYVAHYPPKNVIKSRADKLDRPFVNPRIFTPMSDDQALERMLRPFSTKRRIRWTTGTTFDGDPIYVPLDLIYYGYDSRDLIYFANEFGLAADPDAFIAVRSATESLIKVDALMRTWLRRSTPHKIAEEFLPPKVKDRRNYWRKNGRLLHMTQLDLDARCGEVYLAIIRSDYWPCFATGLAATVDGKRDNAMLEALAEAEHNLTILEAFPDVPAQPSYSVTSPVQHALYYATLNNVTKIDFLLADENPGAPKQHEEDFAEIAKKLALNLVWLKPPTEDYKVARVLSPHLVPLTYGVKNMLYLHPEVFSQDDLDAGNYELPHFYM